MLRNAADPASQMALDAFRTDADPAPWGDANFEVLGHARDDDTIVVALESTNRDLEDPVLAVVRLVEDGVKLDVHDTLLACRSEPLGISFAFPQEPSASGFVVALYAEEGDTAHGGIEVPEQEPMMAWAASVDASHPVEYTSDSETSKFCQ